MYSAFVPRTPVDEFTTPRPGQGPGSSSPARKPLGHILANIGTATKPRPNPKDPYAKSDVLGRSPQPDDESPNTHTRVAHFDRILTEIGSIKAQLNTLEPTTSGSSASEAAAPVPTPRSPPATDVKPRSGPAPSPLEEIVAQLQRQVAALEGRAKLDESLVLLAQEIARSNAQDSATLGRFGNAKEAVRASAAAIGATLAGPAGASLATAEERLRAVEERVARLDGPGRRAGPDGEEAAALQRHVAALEARLASLEADAPAARAPVQALQRESERTAATLEALERRVQALEASAAATEAAQPSRRAQAAAEEAAQEAALYARLAKFTEDAGGRVKAAGEQERRRLAAVADRVDEGLLAHKAAVEAALRDLRTAAARDLELVTGVINNVREEQRALLERARGTSEEEARRGRARVDTVRSDLAALSARVASVEGWCYGSRARPTTGHAALAKPLPPTPADPLPVTLPVAARGPAEREAGADAVIFAAQERMERAVSEIAASLASRVEVADSVSERLGRLEGLEREQNGRLAEQVARVEQAIGDFRSDQGAAASGALKRAGAAEAHAAAAFEKAGGAELCALSALSKAGAAESSVSAALERAGAAEARADAALAAAAKAEEAAARARTAAVERAEEAAERSMKALEAVARVEGTCEGIRSASAAERAAYRADLEASLARIRTETHETAEAAAGRAREEAVAQLSAAVAAAAEEAKAEALRAVATESGAAAGRLQGAVDGVREEAASRVAAVEARLTADIDAVRREAAEAAVRAAAAEAAGAAERSERVEAESALSERVAGALGEHAAAVAGLERHVLAVEERVAALASESQSRGAAVERAEREVAALRATCLEKIDALRAVVSEGQATKEALLHDRLEEIERIVTDVADRTRSHDQLMRELKRQESVRESKIEELEAEARSSKRTLTEALKVMNHALEDADTAACDVAEPAAPSRPATKCPAQGFAALRKGR